MIIAKLNERISIKKYLLAFLCSLAFILGTHIMGTCTIMGYIASLILFAIGYETMFYFAKHIGIKRIKINKCSKATDPDIAEKLKNLEIIEDNPIAIIEDTNLNKKYIIAFDTATSKDFYEFLKDQNTEFK